MIYGVLIDDLSSTRIGITLKITGVLGDSWILDKGQFCDTVSKKAVRIISLEEFLLMQPKTEAILRFIKLIDKQE